MNIENIRAFLEVAATGSFQQAAENLFITQSAMSARIKTLEELLNRQLFNRKRNGATLTAGGQAFYQYALSIVRTWEMARQEIALADNFSSVVSIGVQLNHWKSTAAPWQQWMKDNAVDVATQVRSDYSDRLMSMLRSGLLDAAVLYEPQQNPELQIEQYAEEELILVSSTPRIAVNQSVDGYVYVDWGQTFRTAHSQAFPAALNYQMTVGLAAVALEHILENGGSGYFLRREVSGYLDSGDLFIVEHAPPIVLPTYLAYYSDERATPAVNKAVEGLRAIAPE